MSALRICLPPTCSYTQPLFFTCRHISQNIKTKNSASTKSIEHNKTISVPSDDDYLQLKVPPVLFIRKYESLIDTQHVVVKDELSDLEKRGTITPHSLTQQKIQYILDAVKQTQTFEKLTERLRPAPEPLQSPATSVSSERSVFIDSDFEVIKPIEQRSSPGRLNIAKFETELEWSNMKVDLSKLASHYLMLSKSRLTLLVCLTAAAGYGMAPGPLSLTTCAIASLGTAMASAAANSINQILEVPFDSQMNRTKNRVLVRGHLSPLHAATFAAVMIGSSTVLLCTLVNPVTASLSFFNLILYTSIYTPMKRTSIANTWVGSVVGAVPPLIGWSAATGSLDPGAFVLAGILYTWQFPHFNSLSWNLRPDYSRAGYRMMSVTNPDLCRRVALRHSIGCIAVCTAAPLLDVTTWAFALDSLPLNLYMSFLAWKFYRNADSNSSRKLFRFSLIHLPLLMMLMCLSKKSLSDKSEQNKI